MHLRIRLLGKQSILRLMTRFSVLRHLLSRILHHLNIPLRRLSRKRWKYLRIGWLGYLNIVFLIYVLRSVRLMVITFGSPLGVPPFVRTQTCPSRPYPYPTHDRSLFIDQPSCFSRGFRWLYSTRNHFYSSERQGRGKRLPFSI